ncbi:MAG TPA: hypothetical protein VGD33_04325, partial [Chitinophagaceae bacterium]
NKGLWAMFLYFLIGSLYCLMSQDIIPVSEKFKSIYGILNNYVDVPLMLLVLGMFSTSPSRTRALDLTLILFILYEIAVLFRFGLTVQSSVWIMGPGIIVILVYSVIFFRQYARLSIERNKGVGKTLVVSSMLFLYGCYAMIYYLYYIQKTSARADVYFIYYIVLFIASISVSLGLIMIQKKARQIRELQVTRKELAVILGH